MKKNRLMWQNNVFDMRFTPALMLLIVMSLFVMPVAGATAESVESRIKDIKLQFKNIESKIERKAFNESSLPEVIKFLLDIKSELSQCVATEQTQLEKIKQDKATLGEPVKNELADVRQKRKELDSLLLKSEQRIASCKVLLLKNEELNTVLTGYQQQLLASRLMARGHNVIEISVNALTNLETGARSIYQFLLHHTGFELLTLPWVLLLLISNAVMFAAGYLAKKKILLKAEKHSEELTQRFVLNVKKVLHCYLPYLLMTLVTAAIIYYLSYQKTPLPFIAAVAIGLPIYIFSLGLIKLFLLPVDDESLIAGVTSRLSVALINRLNVLMFLVFTGYLLFSTMWSTATPEMTQLVFREIFVVVLVLNLVWVLWLVGKIPRFEDMVAFRLVASAGLLVLLVIELSGYRNLSSYIGLGVLSTSILLLIFWLLNQLAIDFFVGLDKGRRRWQVKIRESLGIKKRKHLPELSWSKLIIQLMLLTLISVLLMQVWGISEAGYAAVKSVVFDGFTIGSLSVIPYRVALAIVVLIILLAINGWFRTSLEQKWLTATRIERGAREATATISGYVGVAIAILIALSVAGVQFGNLAIIAGALSVGIGFGLQNIVNNFVSGLILLFERPIKTGDWIVVNNTEGFVKRISIRSTQIQTFDQADVIVPNSELISGQVTNWMLRDVRGRIIVPVGVAYGTDTDLVKYVLLDIARNNEMVVDDGSVPEPKVLFMSFGDSALLFELRVFIQNIDKKFQAISDLNFEIDRAFREHNIEIPFPQRDVHIKSGQLENKKDE